MEADLTGEQQPSGYSALVSRYSITCPPAHKSTHTNHYTRTVNISSHHVTLHLVYPIRILTMRSTTLGSTLFLLASAVAAQQSDSVVTEIPSSLVQTTEQAYTIQTSDPVGTGSVCYEVCVQEPCYACAQYHGS
jgi:hypothetical protein